MPAVTHLPASPLSGKRTPRSQGCDGRSTRMQLFYSPLGWAAIALRASMRAAVSAPAASRERGEGAHGGPGSVPSMRYASSSPGLVRGCTALTAGVRARVVYRRGARSTRRSRAAPASLHRHLPCRKPPPPSILKVKRSQNQGRPTWNGGDVSESQGCGTARNAPHSPHLLPSAPQRVVVEGGGERRE